jgi:hypothetical protein
VMLDWCQKTPYKKLKVFTFPVLSLFMGKNREPTSGLKPLTPTLFTSANSGVAGFCTTLQIPHF